MISFCDDYHRQHLVGKTMGTVPVNTEVEDERDDEATDEAKAKSGKKADSGK